MRAIAACCLFAIALSTTAALAADAPAPAAGAALVKERCSRCHTLGRVQRNVEQKRDQAWWNATIDRMQGHGAKLSVEEKSALTGFLGAQATSKDF